MPKQKTTTTPKAPRLELVAAMVPPTVKEIIQALSQEETRAVAQMTRILLEESPRIKAKLKAMAA